MCSAQDTLALSSNNHNGLCYCLQLLKPGSVLYPVELYTLMYRIDSHLGKQCGVHCELATDHGGEQDAVSDWDFSS
jgi:hypothetical protein